MDNSPNPNPPNLKMTAPSPPPRLNGSASSAASATGSAVTSATTATQGSNTPSRTPRSGTPITTHLGVAGKPTVNHKIREKTGYQDTRFAGKEDQLQDVIKALRAKGFIPSDLIENEVRVLHIVGGKSFFHARDSETWLTSIGSMVLQQLGHRRRLLRPRARRDDRQSYSFPLWCKGRSLCTQRYQL